MDKTAIKNFAIQARKDLIAGVKQKAYEYGIDEKSIGNETSTGALLNGRILSPEEQSQRNELLQLIRNKSYEQVMEEVAYTWFNRFIALRFMEVNEYLPSRIRVFTNVKNEFHPEILSEALHFDLEGLDKAKVITLLEANQTEELYKYLLIAQCNDLNSVLPEMFEKIQNYTELLFPNNLLKDGSVLFCMISNILQDDWKDAVEIIGWLYQYYNTEVKDETFALLKKNVKITKERIPSATQLFTPDWIVRYMVENSLGRLWLEGHPSDSLKSNWKYYLGEAEQEPEVVEQLQKIRADYAKIKPQEIKVIDPCMGSGHILVYAFDVLMQIYIATGYSERDAAKSILQNNIFGLDIDDRAYQLSYFAVMMKARKYCLTIFSAGIRPHLYSIQESNFVTQELIDYVAVGNTQLKYDLQAIMETLYDAKEYGSILNIPRVNFDKILHRLEELQTSQTDDLLNLSFQPTIVESLIPLLRQAQVMSQKYDVVVTNPPYMGSSGMSAKLSDFVNRNYPATKSDMSTVCMEKTIDMCKSYGKISMINIPVWMFLASYEKLRENIINKNTIDSMVHFGRGIFGSDFGTTSFVISKNKLSNYQAQYRRLFINPGSVDSVEEKKRMFFNKFGSHFARQEYFKKIPGMPIAYWVSAKVYQAFDMGVSLGSLTYPKQGLASADNNRFLRLWFEVNNSNIGYQMESREAAQQSCKKWFPYNKGGEFKKWYGDREYVINWFNDGKELFEFSKSVIRNPDTYFKPGISYSDVTSGPFSVRVYSEGFIYDSTGPMMFINEHSERNYLLGIMNSKICNEILKIVCPTIHYTQSSVAKLPVLTCKTEQKNEIIETVTQNIKISQNEWDSFEISWDFKYHPLISLRMAGAYAWGDQESIKRISSAYKTWEIFTEGSFEKLKTNEEKLNRIILDIYDLQDELSPEVEEKDVTVRKADLGREIRSLLSYVVGVNFGRYSLDDEGLTYAGGDWDNNKYTTIIPDRDNILPISDDVYFEDDIVSKVDNFLKVVYGEATLEENLQLIADALGNRGDSSRDVIRNYFLNDFYKDHLKIYQKRPIYWLFDSGKKNGFKALIYMHRYKPDLLATMRTDYVHEQQERYRTQLQHLETSIQRASPADQAKINKQIVKLKEQSLELLSYEEKIHHLADQMIDIDLDDGIKVNYAKFEDVLAPIK